MKWVGNAWKHALVKTEIENFHLANATARIEQRFESEVFLFVKVCLQPTTDARINSDNFL